MDRLRASCVLAIASTVVVAVWAVRAAEPTPAGQWRVEFATPMGQRGVNMTITRAGARLAGHVVDEYGEYELTGRYADRRVMVAWSVPENGKMLRITMRGTLDGNLINGTATLGDVGDGPFTARRTGDVADR